MEGVLALTWPSQEQGPLRQLTHGTVTTLSLGTQSPCILHSLGR